MPEFQSPQLGNSPTDEAPASAFTAPQPVDLPDGNTEPGAAACAGCAAFAACAACARAQEKVLGFWGWKVTRGSRAETFGN